MIGLSVIVGDFKPFLCKFRGHVVAKDEVAKMRQNGGANINARCERCGNVIEARIDPDDSDYYLVSDID